MQQYYFYSFILPNQFKTIIAKRLFFDTERVLLNIIWVSIEKEYLPNRLFSAFAYFISKQEAAYTQKNRSHPPRSKGIPRLQLHPATSRLIP